MEGYDVLTTDDDKVGHVVERRDGFLIVETGHLLTKHKHALPEQFAHADESEKVVRITVSRDLVHDSPKVSGDDFDSLAVSRYYGLVEDDAAGGRGPECRRGERAPRDRVGRPAAGGDPDAPRQLVRRGIADESEPLGQPAAGAPVARRPRAPGSPSGRAPRGAPRASSARRPRRASPGPSGSRSPPRGPRGPRSEPASRITQRSQRMPLTWIVSVRTLTGSSLPSGPRRRRKAARRPSVPADLELPVALATSRIERGEQASEPSRRGRRRDELEQLGSELGCRHERPAVRMDEVGARPEARRRPAVLLVEAPAGRVDLAARAHRARSPRAPAAAPRTRRSARRAVGWSGIRSSSVPKRRVRPDVPPVAGRVGRDAELREPLDVRLPARVGAERGRRAAPRQLGEHRRAARHQPRLLAREVRRVRREREHDRQPGQDALERAVAARRRPASRRGRGGR